MLRSRCQGQGVKVKVLRKSAKENVLRNRRSRTHVLREKGAKKNVFGNTN